MKLGLLVLVLLSFQSNAFATCFQRLYSPSHLKKHPKQEVLAISYDLEWKALPEPILIEEKFRLFIDFVRNGERFLAKAEGICQDAPNSYSNKNCRSKDGRVQFSTETIQSSDPLAIQHDQMIRLNSGAPLEIVARSNGKPGGLISITDYDSTMRVNFRDDSTIYSTVCEAPWIMAPFHSKARLWNEVILTSVRNDLARPTVTARNLYHLSALLWDVEAAFDSNKKSLFVDRIFNSLLNSTPKAKELVAAGAAISFLKYRYNMAPANVGDRLPGDSEFGGDGVEDRYLDKFYDRILARLGFSETELSIFEKEAFYKGQEMAEELIALTAKDKSRENEGHTPAPHYQLINEKILDISQSGIRTPVEDVDAMMSWRYEYSQEFFERNPDADWQEFQNKVPAAQFRGDDFSDEINIDHWVRLNIPGSIDQGGTAVASEQSPLTLFWGEVTPFSDLSEYRSSNGLYFDPGQHYPLFAENAEEVIRQNLEVIDYSALLNPLDTSAFDFDRDGQRDFNPGAQLIDISPASLGNHKLGTNNGQGHKVNPVTGKPYEPNRVVAADYYRSIAEFWADGPSSETPPGHWNALANYVVDSMKKKSIPFQWMGQGPELTEDEFLQKLYLTLNGALHDAAIVAWGIKGHYQGNRPVMVIRKLADMAEKDEAFAQKLLSLSDNLKMVEYDQETYLPDGSVSIERRRKLAVRAWRGPEFGSFYRSELGSIELRQLGFRTRDKIAEDEDQFYSEEGVAGVGWILAENWLPYQQATFVTPPFPGFVSGHSTFSRAAAEVLTGATGTPYFPGGMGEYLAPELDFERNHREQFTFQWATYFDAADASGISRIYGGIHAAYDDLPARVIGSKVGKKALEKAHEIFNRSRYAVP